jgi:hypothetical protein
LSIWGEQKLRFTDITKGLSHAVVFNLLPEFFNQGYRLFMDSFYTTNNLVNDLFKKQVYVIGAVRSNSSAMPAVFKNCKSRRFQMAQGRQICDCSVE